MFKTYSSSSSLVITSHWFETSRLVAPVPVRLVYCILHFMWDLIICPCIWNLLQAQYSSIISVVRSSVIITWLFISSSNIASDMQMITTLLLARLRLPLCWNQLPLGLCSLKGYLSYLLLSGGGGGGWGWGRWCRVWGCGCLGWGCGVWVWGGCGVGWVCGCGVWVWGVCGVGCVVCGVWGWGFPKTLMSS